MAQWKNIQRINRFVNPTLPYISSKQSGGLYLAEPDLAAGWVAGRQNSGET